MLCLLVFVVGLWIARTEYDLAFAGSGGEGERLQHDVEALGVVMGEGDPDVELVVVLFCARDD